MRCCSRMVPKMLLVCLSAAFLLVSLEKTTAKNIPKEHIFSQNITIGGIRVRRASEDVLSYVEDLLGGEEKEPKDKVNYSECGRVDLQPTPLITLGEKTERGKWPWHIALYYFEKGGHTYKCGGTLIGRRTVITAAHCVKNNADQTLNPETLLIYLGKHHLKFWNGVQEMQVVDIVVHPDYSISKSIADIAILILSSPADYTSLVRPACLWDNNQVVEKGTPGTVIGWGLDEKGMVTGELMMAKMPIVSDLTCIKSYPEFFGKIVNDMNF
ncbi:hypothetical protein J437_LFUL015100 [Ladona fulva]|uniref:Peptidase S1 domain-containing protein n=1 Tax=Ladona fulva TaxID=123851 RepID=A0A8K0NYI7_LADFU|nr:hypothetical protein J437_LFUL015100 [Ladona fulva]